MLGPSPLKKVKNCHVTLRVQYLLMQKLGRHFFTMFYDTRVLESRQKYKYQCVYLYILKLRGISALLFFVALDLYIKAIFLSCYQMEIPCWGTYRGSFIWHALYQEYSHLSDFVLASLWNLCFTFQIHSLNTCLWVSAYYLITVMAYNKSVYPCGIIYNKIKVELLDSGCLNHGNLYWKD